MVDAITIAKGRKAMEGSGFTLADDGTVVSARTGLPLGALFQQHLLTGQTSTNIEDERNQSAHDKLIDAGQAYASGYREGDASGLLAKAPKSVIDTLIAEAGGNPEGLRAVAAVINNRASQWGLTPHQVVTQPNQFEGYSSPGSASKRAQNDPKVRAAAERAWNDITSGRVADPTNGGVSFRAASAARGMSAPHGTANIGGNVFALGDSPRTALAAIDRVAPVPQSRPAMAYAPDMPVTPLPQVRAPMQLPSDAMYGVGRLTPGQRAVLPTDFASNTGAPATGLMSLLVPQMARQSSPPLVSRSVQTVPIDPMTGNPVSSQSRDLQSALNDYATRLGASRTTGGFKTANPQAGNVPLPPNVVPASAQRDMDAADAQLRAVTPVPAPGSAFGSGWGAGAFLPPRIPGPNGTLVADKDQTRLPMLPEAAYVPVPPKAPAVAAIDRATTPPPAIIPRPYPMAPTHGQIVTGTDGNQYQYVQKSGGVGGTGNATFGWTRLGAPAVPVPGVTAPAPRIGPQPLTKFLPPPPSLPTMIGNGIANIFNHSAPGHVAQFLTGKPVTGGFLSLLQGTPIQAARLVSGGVLSQPAPAAPSQPVGASFLEAQGQNTSGMTDGQVANELKKAMGLY